MPFINSKVTLPLKEEQKEIIKKELGNAIALIPGKSETWLMVGFEDRCSLYFRGEKKEKAAFVEVKIFGKATEEAYSQLTARICQIYETILTIPQDSIYVKYEEAEHWGWNGSNF